MPVSYQLTATIKKLIWDIQTNSEGSANESSQRKPNEKVLGIIRVVLVIPSASNPPSNNFDVTIVDEYGIDILRGQGQDLPNNEAVCFYNIDYPVNGHITASISNGGSEKNLKIILLYN